MSAIPTIAPGCYGSALGFDEAAPVCTVCKFAAECKPAHLANLDALRARLSVDLDRVKPKVKADSAEGGLALSKKAMDLVDKLDRARLHIGEKMSKGINPFDSNWPMLRIAAHILLKRGRLDRPTLSFALQHKLDWAPSTCEGRSMIAMQALRHVGAIDVIDGVMFLRRG